MLTSRRVCPIQYWQPFKELSIFFSKNYIGIVSEEIEFKFSRTLVEMINIQKKRRGPKTETWGTPKLIVALFDLCRVPKGGVRSVEPDSPRLIKVRLL